MANLYDHTGKKNESLTLPKEVFGAKINGALLAQAVHVYKLNQTQGTKRAQTRGDVALTKAKAYRQKGTGNARHGAKSAPIFVGGGQAHGPKGILPRRRSLNAKMRKQSLISAFSTLAAKDAITVVKGLDKVTSKTKDLSNLLDNLKINKGLLLVASAYPQLLKSASNINTLNVSRYNLTNVYDVLNSKHLILDEQSIAPLAKWLTGKEIAEKKEKKATPKTKKVTKTK